MWLLDPRSLNFPPVERASVEGVLAVGGDLRPERLLEAYRRGIFPWYSEGQPILWWAPDPRAVLFPENLKISRSLRKTLRAQKFTVTLDSAFADVMQGCAEPRANAPGSGTWITPDMIRAYTALHTLGVAHSVEAWKEGALAGGLYGVSLGKVFFGESMFTRAPDASKVAFVTLARQIQRWGFSLIDCQQYTHHLAKFGAQEIPRQEFTRRLTEGVAHPTREGPWRFDEHFDSEAKANE